MKKIEFNTNMSYEEVKDIIVENDLSLKDFDLILTRQGYNNIWEFLDFIFHKKEIQSQIEGLFVSIFIGDKKELYKRIEQAIQIAKNDSFNDPIYTIKYIEYNMNGDIESEGKFDKKEWYEELNEAFNNGVEYPYVYKFNVNGYTVYEERNIG